MGSIPDIRPMQNKYFKILLFILISPLAAFSAVPLGWSQGQLAGMTFEIYRPKNAALKASALMINLHGCSQKAADLKKSGNWEAAAELYNMTVVLPSVPNGGVILGCWSYFGTDHSDKEGDSGALISLTEQLLKDRSFNIDAKNVFVSGLSSGAGEAFVVGCLRPDLFSGIGLNSTPMVGSSSDEIHQVPQTAQETADICLDLAKDKSSSFSRQKTSIIYDEAGDYIVNPQHSQVSVGALGLIYGVKTKSAIDMTKLPGANTQGSGILLSDAKGKVRISLINNKGLGHAWASGTGKSESGFFFPMMNTNSYINGNSVDYPKYLGSFFGLKEVPTKP